MHTRDGLDAIAGLVALFTSLFISWMETPFTIYTYRPMVVTLHYLVRALESHFIERAPSSLPISFSPES